MTEAWANRPNRLCADAPYGTYDNQVVMVPPARLNLSPRIGIDLCLASEIAGPWARGIRTVASCCGHRFEPGEIVVCPEQAGAMVALGYERDTRHPDIAAYLPRSRCVTAEPATDTEGEG